jgi:superkiller protein 8
MSQSADGKFTASGHENGSIYVFNNDTGRLSHSLAGLVQPIRSVSFSPASKLLAAAGDARIIALYDVNSGEQVSNFTGHGGWVLSLDWSSTGEYLLSGLVKHVLVHHIYHLKNIVFLNGVATMTLLH